MARSSGWIFSEEVVLVMAFPATAIPGKV